MFSIISIIKKLYKEENILVYPCIWGTKKVFSKSNPDYLINSEKFEIMNKNNKYNVALHIPESLIILDVDTRTDADLLNILPTLSKNNNIFNTLTVKTARNGRHYYFQDINNSAKYLTNSKKYLNIEIKTAFYGKKIMIPPSVFEDNSYKIIGDIQEIKPFPKELENIFKGHYKHEINNISSSSDDPTFIDRETAFKNLLYTLDPHDYAENNTWLSLAMSYHFLTRGQGRGEFITWSLQDERYSDKEGIKSRWDSFVLPNTLRGVVTYKTFLHALKAHNNTIDEATFIEFLKNDYKKEYDYNKNAFNKTVEQRKILLLLINKSFYKPLKIWDLLVGLESIGIDLHYKFNEFRTSKDIIRYLEGIEKPLLTDNTNTTYQFNKTHWEKVPSKNMLVKLIWDIQQEENTQLPKTPFPIKKTEDIIKAIKALTFKNFGIYEHTPKHPVFNFKNICVEVINKKLIFHDHDPKQYLTYVIPYNYDKNAQASKFLTFFEGLFENCSGEYKRHIFELFGYIIQPHKPDPVILILKGPGRVGKTTLIQLLSSLIHPSQYVALEFDKKMSFKDKHFMASLVGKLMAVDDDLSENALLDDGLLKKISQSKQLTAEPKFKEVFSFENTATPIILCNSYPKNIDLSYGMRRRIQFLELNNPIEYEKDDRNFIDKLKDEIPGIFNILISNYINYLDRGYFLQTKENQSAIGNWLKSISSVVAFIDECLEYSENNKVEAKEVFKAFKNFTIEDGGRFMRRNKFYEKLKQNNIIIEKGHANNLFLYDHKLKRGFYEDIQDNITI